MLKRLIIPAVLVLTLGCCTKIVQQSGPMDNTEISYQVLSNRTKAPLEAYPTTVPFVSSAWYLPQGKKWDANKADAQLYISSAVISYDSATEKFKAATPYYWPKKGSLTFMAYSLDKTHSPAYSPEPGKIQITKEGVVVTGWATNGSDKRIDLMVADIVKDKSANGTSYGMVGVPIVFRHILSKVAVTAFIEKDEGKEISLNRIIFHNVYGKADFNGSEWTNRGDVHDVDNTLTPAIKLGIDKKHIIETMLLIPQSLSAIVNTRGDVERGNVEMEIHYTINDKDNNTRQDKTETISLNNHGAAWERGKYTEYQIIFGTSDHPIDFGGSVSVWTGYGNTDIVIGEERHAQD